MKHKWNGKIRNGAVSCINCNCIKEIVRGEVQYFINDTVYLRAPICAGEIDKKQWKK